MWGKELRREVDWGCREQTASAEGRVWLSEAGGEAGGWRGGRVERRAGQKCTGGRAAAMKVVHQRYISSRRVLTRSS